MSNTIKQTRKESQSNPSCNQFTGQPQTPKFGNQESQRTNENRTISNSRPGSAR